MHLQQQVASWKSAKPAFTGELHEYVRSLGVSDGETQEYYDVDMPGQLHARALKIAIEDKFDAVIVDEAQDFAPLWWKALRQCLKDPESNEIYAFLDDRQDVYNRWDGEDSIPDLLPIRIDESLRNTRKIAETFKSFVGDSFTTRGSNGLPVRRVQCSTEDALEVAQDCIDTLIGEGWSNNQIALLTTNNRHPVHLGYFQDNKIAEYWHDFHADEAEFYGHVLGFKGLERSVVILCVIGFKDLARASDFLYVGLSRARCLLVVVGDSELLRQAGGNQLDASLSRAQKWSPIT